ncbi:MAG TPA: hypothetical protein RMG45_28945, partial [Polyangiaceae bacterium LLY-WYZ-15_(1-7)]|nr:hypothetical protein [Polyangiaceae bacterium LLY-WYZ-15_(1-7)]
MAPGVELGDGLVAGGVEGTAEDADGGGRRVALGGVGPVFRPSDGPSVDRGSGSRSRLGRSFLFGGRGGSGSSFRFGWGSASGFRFGWSGGCGCG